MPKFSLKNAFAINAEFFPFILGDITDDPRDKTLAQLNSYVLVRMFTYEQEAAHGLGAYLGGVFGSSVAGTHNVSDNYEAVSYISGGVNGTTKKPY